jgi:hypothetical protein
MLKTILLLTNISIIYLAGLVVGPKEPKVSHTLPTQMVAGEEFWVYVDIDRGKNDGFAKYQIDTPTGFIIEPGDIKGASFTFRDGAAKIIWMNLPDEDEFQISYKLIAAEDCNGGNHTIKQRFAYLENNEKLVFNIPDHVVYVSEQDVANVHVPDTLANGRRKITRLNADHFLVEIDIYKDGIKGFAKIEEIIPAGMNAEAVKKSNAVFTQLDNKAKFVWFSIPEQDSITVVYELFADIPPAANEIVTIEGTFTYLRNNETKSVGIGTPDDTFEYTVNKLEEPIVEEIDLDDEDIEEPEVDLSQVEESSIQTGTIVEEKTPVIDPIEEAIKEEVAKIEEPVVEKEVITAEKEVINSFEEVTSVSGPDKGITYRVQIAAGHNVVDATYFKTRHKFTAPFVIENHESWIKYTTGNFNVYKEARDKRNNVNDNFNFDGPFVTAYNDGERITVQEALMISRQKWYQ